MRWCLHTLLRDGLFPVPRRYPDLLCPTMDNSARITRYRTMAMDSVRVRHRWKESWGFSTPMAQVVVGKRESNEEGRDIYVLREDHLHILLLTHERVLVTRRTVSTILTPNSPVDGLVPLQTTASLCSNTTARRPVRVGMQSQLLGFDAFV